MPIVYIKRVPRSRYNCTQLIVHTTECEKHDGVIDGREKYSVTVEQREMIGQKTHWETEEPDLQVRAAPEDNGGAELHVVENENDRRRGEQLLKKLPELLSNQDAEAREESIRSLFFIFYSASLERVVMTEHINGAGDRLR